MSALRTVIRSVMRSPLYGHLSDKWAAAAAAVSGDKPLKADGASMPLKADGTSNPLKA